MPSLAALPCAPPKPRTALKVVVAAFSAILAAPSAAASSAAIDEGATSALDTLCASSDNAAALAARAQAVLVFAHVANAGLPMGSREGDGVMRIDGASAAYYRFAGRSTAPNTTVRPFSLAFFFVAPSTLGRLAGVGQRNFGAGPRVAVSGGGLGQILDSTALTENVYAVASGQRGLMAGLGLEGSRIFRIHPSV